VSLSANGTRLAVGAFNEDSSAAGIDGDQLDNSLEGSGAVYVFSRTGATWTQEAYIKASNPDLGDAFGYPVALSSDGLRLVVGAVFEDSSAAGAPSDNTYPDSGAAYVFARAGTTWTEEGYLKSSYAVADDHFGASVAIDTDGSRVAVGAPFEGAYGVANGGAYVFARAAAAWSLEGYVQASNVTGHAYFGTAVALSGDGTQLAVGAYGESSAATGIDGNQLDTSAPGAGSVYAFSWTASGWTQDAYLKASNTGTGDMFGSVLSFSENGRVLAIGACNESSSATGLDGLQTDDSATASGAAYVFTRAATWTQRSYVKALNTSLQMNFGGAVSLSGDGVRLAVSSPYEGSMATGINGDMTDQSCTGWCGAVYVY
jgi:hypothetical protein